MTKAELARKAGVDYTTIYRWDKAGKLKEELAKLGIAMEPDLIDADPKTGEVPMTNDELDKELDKIVKPVKGEGEGIDPEFLARAKRINAKFGPGTIMIGKFGLPDTEFLSTQIPEIDRILGGGIAMGRMTEIYGKESCGKTTLALHIADSALKNGMKVIYLDTEHAVDKIYAKALGFDVEKHDFIQPTSIEETGELMRDYCKTLKNAVIIVDSVAAMSSAQEYENNVGAANMGVKARIMGQIIRMITADSSDNKIAIVFINQLRKNLEKYGPGEYTPGGMALKFAASQRLEMKPRVSKDDETDRQIHIKCVKNKVSPPLMECEIPVYFGSGFIKQ